MSLKLSRISKTAVRILYDEYLCDTGGNLTNGDITSSKILDDKKNKKFFFIPREDIRICGLEFLRDFLKKFSSKIKFKVNFKDGCLVKKNTKIAEISGSPKTILSLERTLLNFLQHLSSITTTTSKVVRELKDSNTRLLDTRKTTPGMRVLEKYATKKGGAKNHRINLSDKILIKDNHIKICGNEEKVINILKKKKLSNYQIECDSFFQVKKFYESGCKSFLLDNMKVSDIKKSVSLKSKKKKLIFEISGGINLQNIKKYKDLGADFISSGFITQNPNNVDIGLDIF